MKEVLNAAEASKIIGCRHQVVRYNIRNGIWKFGEVIYPAGERVRKKYLINTRELCKHFQIPLSEAERRLQNGE